MIKDIRQIDPMRRRMLGGLAMGAIATGLAGPTRAIAAKEKDKPIMETHFRNVQVGDVNVFYREAGPVDAPVILLLHGYPSSSFMFRDLIPLLADRYRVIAPDYPGFGYSDAPPPERFDYTFDHLTDVIERFTDALGLKRYALYMQDYGGPVGFRLAERRPERVSALIIQNANAYEDGFTPDLRRIVLRLWTDKSAEAVAAIQPLFELPATRGQFLDGEPDPSLVSPDAWEAAQAGMERPGNKAIQFDLQANYGSNSERYAGWHKYFRGHQPPTLVAWGQGDKVFAPAGATAYQRDLKNIEIHMLDAGHFALEAHHREIAALMRDFLGRKLAA
ncbi:MAG TPA: alpha/beta hydrolase [Sphingomonas sp.]|uniref:alpha/beta fold hydrolase n=1 Tax=Sphingomonas sp. TaxID=28214 RepID=UPI002B56C1BB|nr:alpha/beta hydrolase [Sphingomonas sp.]HMI19636.1 alpha/beta hydrolase [Sphingomonas sp.]